MQLTDLDKPITELIALAPPAIALAAVQNELAQANAQLKARKQVFDVLLERLYADRARAAYQVAGKDTGTVHIPAGNTLALTIERDKDVKWDQTILRTALDGMTAEDARHYAKVEIKVDERKYTAAPPAIKTAFDRARTVTPGKMKFTFKEVELT